MNFSQRSNFLNDSVLEKTYCQNEMSVVVNSSKRTHVTLVTLESPRELLPFYSSVALVALKAFVPLIVPLTTYQSLRKLWNITIPLGGW